MRVYEPQENEGAKTVVGRACSLSKEARDFVLTTIGGISFVISPNDEPVDVCHRYREAVAII